MRFLKNKHSLPSKYFLLKAASLSMMIVGITFALVHLSRFADGYLAYRTAIQDRPIVNNKEEESTALQQLSKQEKNEVCYVQRPEVGDCFGELYIPKLKATIPIYEGTNDEELEKGVGHFSDSVLPGEKDNSVLSGHRDTVFRKLGEVGEGDMLIVKTSAGEFTYKVSKVRIVDKDDRTVIVPKPNATLTVTTCYPFHYIGAAPERYVLVAYLSSKSLKE